LTSMDLSLRCVGRKDDQEMPQARRPDNHLCAPLRADV